MLNYYESYKFEDPNVPNFVFWANPDTFGVDPEGYYVYGDLYVDYVHYNAYFYWSTIEQFPPDVDFYTAYRAGFKSWGFDVPGFSVFVENDKLVIKQLDEVVES